MKPLLPLILLTAIASAETRKDNWIPLFNGKDFDGWTFDVLDDNEKKPGEWNQLRVLVEGGNITVHVNGDLVNKGTKCSGEKGAICLQSERANVQFRNIRLKPLNP